MRRSLRANDEVNAKGSALRVSIQFQWINDWNECSHSGLRKVKMSF